MVKKTIKIRVFREYTNSRPWYVSKEKMTEKEFLRYIKKDWKVADYANQNGGYQSLSSLEEDNWSWKKGFINMISD